MKSTLSKLAALTLAITGLASIAAPAAAQADTHCYIYISGQCRHNGAPSNTWFEDNYDGSQANNGRCLQRAREYHQWCQLSPGSESVNAAFNLANRTISAQKISGPGQVVTFGLDWTPLPVK